MSEFVKIILIILLSSVKFVAGPPFAYFDERYDFTFYETVLYCLLGGMLGVWVFTFFSLEIQLTLHWIRSKFRRQKDLPAETRIDPITGLIQNVPHKRKIFSKRSRQFVKLWRRYGFLGVAFFTPVLISIPVGTIILNLFEDNKLKIFTYMFFSILFWSVLLTAMFEILEVVDITQLREKLFG